MPDAHGLLSLYSYALSQPQQQDTSLGYMHADTADGQGGCASGLSQAH